MTTRLNFWGSSCGLRIPVACLRRLGLKAGDSVKLRIIGDSLVVTKEGAKSSLENRLESFYHKPIDEIGIVGEE